MGRPRSVSAEELAPAVAVRLPPTVLAEIDALGASRSDAIRVLLEEAFAARQRRSKR